MFQWSTLAPFKVPQPCHKMAPRMMESGGPRSGKPPRVLVVSGTEFRCLWRWQAVPQTKISLKGLKSHLFRSTQLFFWLQYPKSSNRCVGWGYSVGLFFFLVFCFLKPLKIGGVLGFYQFPVDWGWFLPKKADDQPPWVSSQENHASHEGEAIGPWGSPQNLGDGEGGSAPDVLEWQGIDWSRKADATDVPVWYMWDAERGCYSGFGHRQCFCQGLKKCLKQLSIKQMKETVIWDSPFWDWTHPHELSIWTPWMLPVFFDVAELWTVQLDVEIMALAMYVTHRENPEFQDDRFGKKTNKNHHLKFLGIVF